MRFPTSFLDDIRDRVPISTIVARRVTFDRKKSNPGRGDFWACCPFHGEKSPSFHCEDRKGRYHCFGCGVTGDHFRYLTELEGLSFPEAVETVAGIAGIPMPARDEKAEQRDREQASLFDVMDLAATYFQEQLQAANGAKARGYLRERGLSAATQLQFRLGYSNDSRNALKEYLAGKGIPKDQIEACGLVVHGDDIPVSYDRFRDRIMFPIPDSRGRIIAFGGRALSKDVPAKYLNSPDTELFHKGQVLFNYAKARKPAQDKGTVIAVEGYMDVIAIAQAGFHHAVAPLGTALTERQSELLWKMANEPILCFDGDQAGTKAAWRAADLVLPLLKPGKTFPCAPCFRFCLPCAWVYRCRPCPKVCPAPKPCKVHLPTCTLRMHRELAGKVERAAYQRGWPNNRHAAQAVGVPACVRSRCAALRRPGFATRSACFSGRRPVCRARHELARGLPV